MADDQPTQTDSDLLQVLRELQAQEPIFHRPEFASTSGDFDRLMAADYWEVGASGRCYSREFVLQTLKNQSPADAHTVGWLTSNFACRRLGPDTYLLTYTLDQAGRITRRTTIWRRNGAKWKILFHQGTIVEAAIAS